MEEMVDVIPGRLFQSGRPIPRGVVEDREVNAIVSVSGGEQPWIEEWMEAGGESLKPGHPQQRLRVQVPLIDASHWLDEAAADAVVDMVYRLLCGDDTRRVLVHCDAGAFRSVHVAALVLSKMHALPPRYAFAEIDEYRGRTPPRDTTGLPGWVEHLDSYNLDDRWPTPDPAPGERGRAMGDKVVAWEVHFPDGHVEVTSLKWLADGWAESPDEHWAGRGATIYPLTYATDRPPTEPEQGE